MTRNVYTHVTRAMLDGASAVIEEAVSDITGQVAGSPNGSPQHDKTEDLDDDDGL